MNKRSADRIEIYENADVPSEEIQADIQAEIDSQPTDSQELMDREMENTAASPATSGGDLDAAWEEANTTGEEAFAGSNPTPDQSDTEANGAAMGVTYQDNEPLDIEGKLNRRDQNRYELDPMSKDENNSI